MRTSRHRAQRGAAAVETALCMLVIIPVFMYALFLDDLLRHALDGQETALSTAWDFTVQNYPKKASGSEPFDGFSGVQQFAQQMFCDHESGIDSFGPGKGPECENDEGHHQELSAHACWLNPGAQQVQCTLNQADPNAGGGGGPVGAYNVTLHQSYMDQFSKGGIIRCSARLGVQNYLLPKSFLQDFSQVGLARQTMRRGDGIHNNAQGSGDLQDDPRGLEGNVYLLPWERIAIVTDTWALTKEQKLERGKKDSDEENLYVRVAQVYKNQDNQGYSQMTSPAEAFVNEATQEVLSPDVALDQMDPGDDPREPSLSIVPFPESGGPQQEVEQYGSSASYFNSEWRDWDADNNEATHNARGNNYLGCSSPESC
ncbi:hypothetical protein JY572_20585 [Myxococcus landrumensis]|uniref:Pilus assembly protein n=2 Tax=Myxococcus landrumensis TaxID=2813577 RepID=A0ABX7MWL7_9BACT|nr:hypothetical protein JY572_20585 [Myxococcus landrumus]